MIRVEAVHQQAAMNVRIVPAYSSGPVLVANPMMLMIRPINVKARQTIMRRRTAA